MNIIRQAHSPFGAGASTILIFQEVGEKLKTCTMCSNLVGGSMKQHEKYCKSRFKCPICVEGFESRKQKNLHLRGHEIVVE